MNKMAVRNYNGPFQKPTREVSYTKIQEFINRNRHVKTIVVNIYIYIYFFFLKKNIK